MAPLVAEELLAQAGVVPQMRALANEGWGAKRIAKELEVARNTVKRILREGPADVQMRPAARRLDDLLRAKAVQLFDGAAEGSAVVVNDLLAADGVGASVPTVHRAVEVHRQEQRAAEVASVR